VGTFHGIDCSYLFLYRKFISVEVEAKRTATLRHTARQASINLSRSGVLLDEMGNVRATFANHLLHSMTYLS